MYIIKVNQITLFPVKQIFSEYKSTKMYCIWHEGPGKWLGSRLSVTKYVYYHLSTLCDTTIRDLAHSVIHNKSSIEYIQMIYAYISAAEYISIHINN